MAKREPKSRSRKTAPTLKALALSQDPFQSWFCRDGCLVRRAGMVELVVHGTKVAAWKEGESAIRNAMLVQLAQEPNIVLEDLSKAFRLSSEMVRLIRRKAESEGLLAVMLPASRTSTAIAPEVRMRLERLFAKGMRVEEVYRRMNGKVARSTVSKYLRLWKARPRDAAPVAEPRQRELPSGAPDRAPNPVLAVVDAARGLEAEAATAATPSADCAGAEQDESKAVLPAIRATRGQSEYSARAVPARETAFEERAGAGWPIRGCSPRSRRAVQNAGCWLLMALVGLQGLYDDAEQALAKKSNQPVRIALDVLIGALAIGEGCVEGARRLATSLGSSLLLASAAPSATWIRRALGRVAGQSEEFHRRLVGRLIRKANEEAIAAKRPLVFYVDNHTREYTGRQTLTWHWKMQAKRAVKGVTDYWIHDSHGRPVSPVTAFQQGSLVELLPRCASIVRGVLGKEPPVLFVFDRGGAFPAAMVELRRMPEGAVDFLTYERAPFQRHGREWFERHGTEILLRDRERDGAVQRLLVADAEANLGEGRGRVRRLMLLMPDDAQINLLTSSQQAPAWLAQTLFSRWRQENAFKYGAERWGFNQLDSRQVEQYPAGTTIPNPYRRNLERSRDDALEREGKLRCRLARLRSDDPRRTELECKLAQTTGLLAMVREALSRSPKRIEIENTHLARKLVRHKQEYKLLVDTVRVACANAEDRLALELQKHLANPGEAKRVLQNLFKAPGNIRVSESEITVSLDPCGNSAELRALRMLLAELESLPLTRPGDPRRRCLKFALQKRVVISQIA